MPSGRSNRSSSDASVATRSTLVGGATAGDAGRRTQRLVSLLTGSLHDVLGLLVGQPEDLGDATAELAPVGPPRGEPVALGDEGAALGQQPLPVALGRDEPVLHQCQVLLDLGPV